MVSQKKSNTIFAMIIISIIYIIPISSTISSKDLIHGDVYIIARLSIIVVALFSIVLDRKRTVVQFVEYVLLLSIFVLKFLHYEELDLGILFLNSFLILYDYMRKNEFEYELFNKFMGIVYYIFVIQILVFSTVYFIENHAVSITSSFLDRNYTGYFITILFFYFFYNKDKHKYISLVVMGLFTYSRTFILCILIYALISLFFNKIVNKLIKSNMIFYLFVQSMLLLVSYIYVVSFENYDYVYKYVTGFARLGNLFDYSNYIRMKLNILAIKSIDPVTFVLGLKQNSFIGLELFQGKAVYPHNTFWTLFVSYGMIISQIVISRFLRIFRELESYGIVIFIPLLIYSCLLGPSYYYGVDTLIQLILFRNILRNSDNEEIVTIDEEKNRCTDFCGTQIKRI